MPVENIKKKCFVGGGHFLDIKSLNNGSLTATPECAWLVRRIGRFSISWACEGSTGPKHELNSTKWCPNIFQEVSVDPTPKTIRLDVPPGPCSKFWTEIVQNWGRVWVSTVYKPSFKNTNQCWEVFKVSTEATCRPRASSNGTVKHVSRYDT